MVNWRGRVLLGLLAGAAGAAGADAQDLTLYGVGSGDGDGTRIVLVGGTVQPAGLGLKPQVGLQAHWLQYDGAEGNESVVGITPSVGLQYRMQGGAVEGRIGYSLQDDVAVPIIAGEGGSGFTTTLAASSWATRPELQGLATYNWNNEFLWTEAQAVLPVMRLDAGSLGVGAELIYQTVTADDAEGHALQYGPVLRYNNGRNFMITAGGGRKDNDVGEDTWYARLTAVSYGLKL